MTGPRIALLGFSIECNRFAPMATEIDFSTKTLLTGQAMLDDARSAAPRMLGEMPGFLTDMDAAGPWQPLPCLLAMAEPNGPVDAAFFQRMLVQWERELREAPYAGRVLNVSVMGGFAFSDTKFNGLTAVVTATDPEAARSLAREIAEAGWARRDRFSPKLTSLEAAVRLAKGTEDRANPALIFADVADNPGGGGRGNTMHILQAFVQAGVRDAIVGVINDPALAAEAHGLGIGSAFLARFNRGGGDAFSHPCDFPATVTALVPPRVTPPVTATLS